MTHRIALILAVALLATSTTACDDETDPSSTAKGAEEDGLGSGKDDSFGSVTEHGQLAFGIPSSAEISTDQRFHAWTYEVKDDANVTLTTNLTPNLDTVMYLYYRADPSSEWGPHIEKNDDFGDNVSSQISHRGEAGEYRVIVKPFKNELRGTFSLVSECDGPGCDAGPVDGVCDPAATAFSTATETSYAPSCAGDIRDILSSLVTDADSYSVSVSIANRCSLQTVARKAAEAYYDYWDGLVGWSEFVPDDDTELNINVVTHGDAGTIIGIDVGGDQDSLNFVFDHNDDLVMHYHDEQSTTVGYYCQDNGEQASEEPPAECVVSAVYGMPHASERTSTGSTTGDTAEARRDLRELGHYAVKSFLKDYEFSNTDVIQYSMAEYRTWEGEDGVTLTFNAGDEVATYDVFAYWACTSDPCAWRHYVTLSVKDGETAFQCDNYATPG